jgi:hypothetical protein
MLFKAKHTIKSTWLFDLLRPLKSKLEVKQWEKNGRLPPLPPSLKQKIVINYAKQYGINTLVETGTYFGDMVWAAKKYFKIIFSIEIDEALYDLAKKRFRKFKHVSILHGDSGEVLNDVFLRIMPPSLFWLDAHYSGGITSKGAVETPIYQELQNILAQPGQGYFILIDDARCFTGEKGYPTIQEIRDIIFRRHPDWLFLVAEDIIRAHPAT